MVYLIKSASYDADKVFYKIGFTANILKRLPKYITHNPTAELLQYVDTYSKTKHRLEIALHKELKALGYRFHISYGITTEWIEVDKNKPIRLEQFKACKYHKVVTLKE